MQRTFTSNGHKSKRGRMFHDACNTWSLIFQFLTAVGTIGAVWVALFQMRNRDKPKITLRCGKTQLTHDEDPDGDYGEAVYIIAKNIGIRKDSVVTYWFSMLWGKDVITVVDPPIIDSTKYNGFPADLKPGEEATALIELDHFKERVLAQFIEQIKNKFHILVAARTWKWYLNSGLPRSLKCTLYTARDTRVTVRVDRSLQALFLEDFKQQLKS